MARKRLIAAVAEVNATRRPEEDRWLRLGVMACVMTGALAVLLSGSAPLGEALVVLALLPVGFWWSNRQRATSNWLAKAIISVLAIVVLGRFFSGLSGITSVDDARLPLTQLFLEIQVLHAFDLPQRRDLMFSLASSLALVGLALASAPGLWMVAVLALYGALCAVTLHRYAASVNAEWVDRNEPDRQPSATHSCSAAAGAARSPWQVVGPVAAALAIAALLFSAVPLRADSTLGGLPFSFPGGGPPGQADAGEITEQLPFSDGADGTQPFDPVAYFGFADAVNPRQVGELDDTPIMRVRTNHPRPLRGVVFDTYDDGVWRRSEEEPPPRRGLPVEVATSRGQLSTTRSVTQTVELLHATPNLLFAASDPSEVWIASRSITQWSDGTLTTPIEMDAGTVYSVVSEVEVSPREELRVIGSNPAAVDPQALARWTDLPDSVPQRVHELATRLADRAVAATPYAVAESVQAWIGEHVRYSLGADPTPPDSDPADHLLFEQQLGWCEPIATAMVVLLRSVDIPARFVTGFQPGDRDLLSGQYIVRARHAHAWVEVFIAGVGWVPFDPTGATAPVLDPEGPGSQILLAELWAAVVERLPDDPRVWLGLVVAAALSAGAVVVARRRLVAVRRRRAGPWARLLGLLEDRGVVTRPTDTPREVVGRAHRTLPDLDGELLELVRAHEEHRRYEAPGPSAEDAHRAMDQLSSTGRR